MATVKLCTRLTLSRIIDQTPTRIELVVCLEDQLNTTHGWFISPEQLKSRINHVISPLSEEYFFSKNHLKLVGLLRKGFQPHKIQKVEINLNEQKSIYET
ncbi:MAG: hypothetical protein MK008_12345 [Bdellovibrionales bacterium]|nr:hypothetical protein [Bdellovibrionales bacterium]